MLVLAKILCKYSTVEPIVKKHPVEGEIITGV